MPVEFYRFKVQKEIRDRILAGPFYAVSYDPDTKEPSADLVTPLTPASVVVNEVSALFEDSREKRRALAQDRTGWDFQAIVQFDQEVAAEKFEEAWADAIPKVAPDVANGRPRAVWLYLGQINYRHPLQHEGSGCEITYTIEARLTPR